MSFISDLAAGGLEGILKGVKDVISEFHMSPEDKGKLELALREQEIKIRSLLTEADRAQTEINKVEAASSNLFVSGWRPYIGWTCGAALSYIWIIRDFIVWGIAAGHLNIPTPPLVMGDQVLELTLGMLGMGALRSWDKYNASKNGAK